MTFCFSCVTCVWPNSILVDKFGAKNSGYLIVDWTVPIKPSATMNWFDVVDQPGLSRAVIHQKGQEIQGALIWRRIFTKISTQFILVYVCAAYSILCCLAREVWFESDASYVSASRRRFLHFDLILYFSWSKVGTPDCIRDEASGYFDELNYWCTITIGSYLPQTVPGFAP